MSVLSREELDRLACAVIRFDTGLTDADSWDRIHSWASLVRIQTELLNRILTGEVLVGVRDDELVFQLNPDPTMTRH